MNNAKKIMKNQGNMKKKKTKKETTMTKYKALVIAGLVLVVLIVGGVLFEQLKPKLMMTIDGEKLYRKDVMYDIYNTEAQGKSMDDMYKQFNGTGYWDMKVSETGTTTYRDKAKTDIQKLVEQRFILVKEAEKAGMALTDAERKSAEEQSTKLRKDMTTAQKGMSGLDETSLKNILLRDVLASKYKKSLIDAFNIDDAALTKTVSKKDYRQYKLQCYYVSTKKTENNKSVDMTAKEKETLKTQMTTLFNKGKTAKDYTKLVADNDKSGIKYQETSFVETDKEKGFLSKDLVTKAKKMKNGEYINVSETDGYLVFGKMENNNSTEAYDEQVKTVISNEETKQFNAKYEEIEANYDITLNKIQWQDSRLKIGTVTL